MAKRTGQLTAICLALAAATGAVAQVGETRKETLAERLDGAEQIVAVGPEAEAAGLHVTAGHLSVQFSEGKVARVRDGHGELGVVVEGRGQARYASEDPLDKIVFSYNVAEMTRLRPHDGEVTFKIRRALVLASRPSQADGGGALEVTGAPVEMPSTRGGGNIAGSGSRARRLEHVLASVLSDCRKVRGWDFPMRRVVELENGTAPTVFIRLEGKARVSFVRDAEAGVESLSIPVGDTMEGFHYETLSRQPPARAAGGNSPAPWELSRLGLEMLFEKAPQLVVRADLTLAPSVSGQRILLLHLDERKNVAAAFVTGVGKPLEVHSLGKANAKMIHVRSVGAAGGGALDFVHRHDTLAVALDAPSAAGTAVRLIVDMDTELARLPAGHEYFSVREPGWFPLPPNQKMRYALTWKLRSREPFRPIITGDSIEDAFDSGEYRVAGWLPIPVRGPVFACGKYVMTSEQVPGGALVRVWTYARGNPQAASIARFCAGALRWFSLAFGPYALPHLDVVEAAPMTGGQSEWGIPLVGGQSGPGILLVSGMDLEEQNRARRFTGSVGFNMVFAHEVAHQWWGQKIGAAESDDQWLLEALAEYSAWLFVRELRAEFREEVPERWRDIAGRSARVAPLAGANRLAGEEGRSRRADLIYFKGALMMLALSKEVGEERFVRALAAFANEFTGREVSGADFLSVLNRETGKDLTRTYQTWLYRTGMPPADR